MNRPQLDPSRASDALLVLISTLALVALLPLGTTSTVVLAVMTVALIAWPFGVLMWLARRWARAGDLRFVLLAVALAVTAIVAALLAISIGQ